MRSTFRLTLAQLNPTVGDLTGNAAKARAEDMAREKTAELTAGLPIPPGMKLPF